MIHCWFGNVQVTLMGVLSAYLNAAILINSCLLLVYIQDGLFFEKNMAFSIFFSGIMDLSLLLTQLGKLLLFEKRVVFNIR
jgi:hypothetical protein